MIDYKNSAGHAAPIPLPRHVPAGWLIENSAVEPVSVLGDTRVLVSSIATPSNATVGSMCFYQHGGPTPVTSMASLIVAPYPLSLHPTQCGIIVSDPRSWVADALELLLPKTHGIDPTALVGKNVSIGSNVSIGPYAVLGDGVSVGDDTVIGPHVYIHGGTAIGHRCIVEANTTIGSAGFSHFRGNTDHMYTFPHLARVMIGDDVSIGANTVIVRGMLRDTIIGSGVKIGNLCNIGHECRLLDHTTLTSGVTLGGTVEAGVGSDVGLGASVKHHIHIGAHARVGMGSAVTSAVTDNEGVFGVPARKLRTMRPLTWPNR
ncbi:MAG: DapH/DapD/GlmU-related protein [Terriglobia bacterium]